MYTSLTLHCWQGRVGLSRREPSQERLLLKYSAAQAAEAKTIRFWATCFVLDSSMMLKCVEVVLAVKRAEVVVDILTSSCGIS